MLHENNRYVPVKKAAPGAFLVPGALLSPALVIILGVLLYPSLCTIFYSFTDKTLSDASYSLVGLKNYAELFSNPKFWKALRHSVMFTAIAGSLNILVGLGMALLMNLAIPFRGLFRSLLLIPWVMPPIVTGLMFRWLYNDFYGYLNYLLLHCGLVEKPILFLVDKAFVWPAVILPTVWFEYPFVMLMFLAALQSISPELYKAAKVDGANGFQRLVHITLPGLRQAFLLNGLLQIIFMFKSFNLVWILTQGGPGDRTELLSTLAYRHVFEGFTTGYGSAVATIIFLVLFVVSVVYLASPATGRERA